MARAGARRYWLIWAAVIPVAVWAAIRLFGLERGFVLVPLMAYTPYAAVAALLVSGIAIALRNWVAGAVAVLATACLLAAVLPRALGSRAEVPPGAMTVDVLSSNIHLGGAGVGALMDLVRTRDPDVLALQELTPAFAQKLERAGIERLLPNSVLSVRRQASGGGIYSKFSLRRMRENASYGFRMPRAEAQLPDGSALRIVDVHPYTPQRSLLTRWYDGLESLPSTGEGTPWVLVGDFNATLDHAELREVIDGGYRDAADAVGEGLFPTWPRRRLLPPPVTIDHVLADRRFDIADYAVAELPGTDHRAIYARLVLPEGP